MSDKSSSPWLPTSGLLAGLMTACLPLFAGEFPVNQISDLDQERPALAQLLDGRIVSVWEDESSGVSEIRMRWFDAQGQNPGPELQVAATAGQDQADPAIAALTDGGLVIAWSSRAGDADDYAVAFRRFDSNGTPTTALPELANSLITGPQLQPQLAALPGGAFVVVWVAQNGGLDQDVMYRRFAAGAGSLDSTEVAANRLGVPGIGEGDQGHARVAALVDGGYVITFEDRPSGGVYGVRFDAAGQALEAPGSAPDTRQFQVSPNDGGEYTEPAVAGLVDGGFVVALTASPDALAASRKVWLTLFDADGIGGTAFPVGNHSTRWEAPQVIALGDGDFVAGWQVMGEGDDQPTGTGSVWLQQFQPNGTPRQPPLMINEYNTGHQRRLALAALKSRGVGALWQSQGQDGDGYGVFGNTLAPQLVLPGRLLITPAAAGGFSITFIGTAGRTHVLQRSFSLGNDWETVVTDNPPDGILTYATDSGAPPELEAFRAWTNP